MSNDNSIDIVNSLPENPSSERNQIIIKAVEDKLIKFNWIPITSEIPGHKAIFYVTEDAGYFELENDYRYRPQVTATMTQQCADILGASMVTAKIMDLSYKQAAIVEDATILPAGPQMSSSTYSKKYNDLVEKKRAGRSGLFRDCGKSWLLSNRLPTSAGAVNYGFYYKKAPYVNSQGAKLYQPESGVHDASHQDYSQVLFLMDSTCIVDDVTHKVSDIMQDKELCQLINYDGILKYTRQPHVDLIA